MKSIQKVVLLSDDDTSSVGILFLSALERALTNKRIAVWHQRVLMKQNLPEAVERFDKIPLEIKPDLLIVADFACIKMQSEQEEPFYNNFEMPVIHLLFRRPWEYGTFMIWRSNFTTRYYCVQKEDTQFIRRYYPRLLNVAALDAGVWNCDGEIVSGRNVGTKEEVSIQCGNLPEYLITIGGLWQKEKQRYPDVSDDRTLENCLAKIGFECTQEEFLDILYLMVSVFASYHLQQDGMPQAKVEVLEGSMAFTQQIDDFLNLDFPVSLL